MAIALYRCAACGSNNVITDKQVTGLSYNQTKGLLGNAILGPGGAFFGFENGAQQIYICKDCNARLTAPMPSDIKLAIDIGVSNPSARYDLSRIGVPLSWNFLTSQYPNIEKGNKLNAKEIPLSPLPLKERRVFGSQPTKQEKSIAYEALDNVLDYINSPAFLNGEWSPHLCFDYRRNSVEEINEQLSRYEQFGKEQDLYTQELNKEYRNILLNFPEMAKKKAAEATAELEQKLRSLSEEFTEHSTKLASQKKEFEKQRENLSRFKFKERKRLAVAISDIDNEIAAHESRFNDEKKKLENKLIKARNSSQSQEAFVLCFDKIHQKIKDTTIVFWHYEVIKAFEDSQRKLIRKIHDELELRGISSRIGDKLSNIFTLEILYLFQRPVKSSEIDNCLNCISAALNHTFSLGRVFGLRTGAHTNILKTEGKSIWLHSLYDPRFADTAEGNSYVKICPQCQQMISLPSKQRTNQPPCCPECSHVFN